MTKVDKGSFRDPSGSVFYHEGEVYRSIDTTTLIVMRKLVDDGLLDTLAADGLVVGTRIVDDDSDEHRGLLAMMPSAAAFLHHDRVPFVSYPHEWSVSMLADAACLQLKLQLRLLEKGYSLKDATAYNVQFVKGRPVFIDIPSIEIPERKDAWIAYGQFCRMHLFPLLLRQYRHIDTRGYYLSHIDGMDVNDVRRILGKMTCLRPALFVDVFLQGALQKQGTRHPDELVKKKEGRRGEGDRAVQEINLRRLMRKIEGMKPGLNIQHPTKRDGEEIAGEWSRYAEVNSYSEEGEKEKKGFVKRVLEKEKPGTVLDLGCNTGEYSLIAADAGIRVVSVDLDHDCVDALYRRQKPEILPLWMDISNPSPGTGFRNQERASFLERASFDCVMALALMHHLVVSARIPLPEVRDLFHSLAKKWLIIECVPVGDAMFQQLLALRANIYTHVTQTYFEEIFKERFKITESLALPGSGRIMYLMEKV